jgi:hypothetical protein
MQSRRDESLSVVLQVGQTFQSGQPQGAMFIATSCDQSLERLGITDHAEGKSGFLAYTHTAVIQSLDQLGKDIVGPDPASRPGGCQPHMSISVDEQPR